jgi:hypothetical protein
MAVTSYFLFEPAGPLELKRTNPVRPIAHQVSILNDRRYVGVFHVRFPRNENIVNKTIKLDCFTLQMRNEMNLNILLKVNI